MKIFGLIGEKLGHSMSPYIHNKIFNHNKINGVYNLFSVSQKNKNNIVESLKNLGISGCNVTIPYKEVVMEQLDFISEEAKKIGSVNTILLSDGKAYGYNTDYYGFGKMLERKDVKTHGNSFFVLGAGGASRSVLKYLEDNGAKKIVLVSRDKEKAKRRFKNFNVDFMGYDELNSIEKEFAIINTTPCGMYPNVDTMAISREVLKKFNVAIDIVYNPLETKFLKNGKELGLKTVNGLFMLVGQGVKANEIWNGIKVEKSTEEEIYNELKKRF
ncbi:shikimate dehydrogenase [Clostridium sp.]|uniref:shikimate dehydrogenase n=1 Tax=Clostridium sp. TaxID=1506 RepID=UPI0026029129|nr:shikimate dehydrogenase [Clostridium sp.]